MVPVKPTFFATPAAFGRWLRANHATAGELLVGFWKRDSGTPSMTWPESVDEALCVGWIDGVRKRIDDVSYTIRFSPRRPTSIWSSVNVARVAVLTAEGRMLPAGLEAFARRSERRSGIYSYERVEEASFSPAELARFKANAPAWTFFAAQPPGYRKQMLHRVLDAKRADTRARRLDALIALSAEGKRMR